MTRLVAPEVVVHTGPAHGRTDVPFVIIPGLGMSHRYSARLHNTLARTSTVHSLDLSGFGGVPKPAASRLTVPDYAEAIARALDDREVRRAVIIGHSMGAQFAVELSRIRPSLPERVVLAAPVVDPRRRTARHQTLDLLHDLFLEPAPTVGLVTGDYVRTGPRWFFTELRSMLEYRIVDEVGAVTCPVLVVRGEHDPIARRAFCEELAARAVDGELAEIAGAAHVLQHTDPERFARIVRAFADIDMQGLPR
ncbi:alpha/beta hydrolase [Herbiconiux sp. CPCC 205763]|uniref:Alpha/beta hydrolase n=1 Tax=Herbiconiux aconitum TaxID=2970913 RepID=A0ABT2GNQ1_9MICO|nr:alpha/beta hydrolase [Herbiconiux aconitum]MCS5717803.1 alpha/beta hydrolase [Herbiconiux aconitum]